MRPKSPLDTCKLVVGHGFYDRCVLKLVGIVGNGQLRAGVLRRSCWVERAEVWGAYGGLSVMIDGYQMNVYEYLNSMVEELDLVLV
jgi:hypothetical protein